MLKKSKDYFSSYEKFVQLQYGLRRRILEYYYKSFRRYIVRKLNRYSKYAISNNEFLNGLISIINLPYEIIVNETERTAIIEQAEKTINGFYNLLGSGDIELNPIDWHIDFKSGFRWPQGTFYRKYIQESMDSNSDVKIPRELSRCHHLLKLGLAYRLTNDEKYAEVCIAQMKNWIDENPLMYSINWGCTMDVAIRTINWIWTLGLIIGSRALDKNATNKIKSSLYQHGWYIWRNPEKAIYNSGNHYLADLSGQIHLGLLFKNVDESKKWLKKGKEELFREIRMQILPSGMSYERSTNYHRLVLELIIVPILLLKKNGHEIPSDLWYRLEKIFEFTLHSLKPDGNSPIVGDQDNGRLLPFGTEGLNDYRYLMSLGGLLFDRSDFKSHGDGYNVYCSLLGGQGTSERWNKISELRTDLKSKAFPDAGIYIMRKKDNYLLFNATGKGLYPELESGTHTHSDLFSFELFTNGKSFIIDPGSYVYTADAYKRMLFRSTKMHNTVTIDGESQNTIQKEVLWDFCRDAIPEVLKWESNANYDIVTAIQNGYTRLPEPVIHERTLIFDKTNEEWIIKDVISGTGYHTVEWFFHFDVDIDFEIAGNKVETKCEDDRNIIISFENQSGLSLRKEKSFVSKSYGTIKNGNVLVAMIKKTIPVTLSIEIKKFNKI